MYFVIPAQAGIQLDSRENGNDEEDVNYRLLEK